MWSVEAVTDLVARGADFYRHYVPADWVAYPNVAAVGVAVAGILFAFWGVRLLRTIYMLAFLVLGAAIGVKAGRHFEIDVLVGLTFGAGIAAFLGYLLFRWWVGVSAGLVAVLVIVAVAWPRIQELQQGYYDLEHGVGTGVYVLGGEQVTLSPAQYATAVGWYAWEYRREFATRLLFAVGLGFMLGTVTGLLLPKFTMVLGTTLIGVVLMAIGAGVFLWLNFPGTWEMVAGHPDWYLVGMGAMLIVAAWRQVRPGRVRAEPVLAAPPEGASAE